MMDYTDIWYIQRMQHPQVINPSDGDSLTLPLVPKAGQGCFISCANKLVDVETFTTLYRDIPGIKRINPGDFGHLFICGLH